MFSILKELIKDSEISATTKMLAQVGVHVLEALVIILVGIIVYKIINYFIKKLITARHGKMSERKAETLKVVLISVSKYLVIFIVACQVLPMFGVQVASILAVAGIGSVAIGFGAQGLVKDFITGIFILVEDQFGVGDMVNLNGFTGVVETIGMRTTRIRGENGDLHIIPNSQIQVVTNKSKGVEAK